MKKAVHIIMLSAAVGALAGCSTGGGTTGTTGATAGGGVTGGTTGGGAASGGIDPAVAAAALTIQNNSVANAGAVNTPITEAGLDAVSGALITIAQEVTASGGAAGIDPAPASAFTGTARFSGYITSEFGDPVGGVQNRLLGNMFVDADFASGTTSATAGGFIETTPSGTDEFNKVGDIAGTLAGNGTIAAGANGFSLPNFDGNVDAGGTGVLVPVTTSLTGTVTEANGDLAIAGEGTGTANGDSIEGLGFALTEIP